MKQKILHTVFVGLLLAGAVGLYLAQRQALQTETVRPQTRTVIEAVYATGEVEPVYEAAVSSQVTSRVVDVLVHEGQSIKKGAILARLDDSAEKALLAEYMANRQYLQREIERQSKLVDKGHASERDLDKIKSQFEQATARLESQKQLVARIRVDAPMDGTVLRRDIEPGETVQPGQVLFHIGKLQPLRISAEVDEEDIPLVRLGQEALIKADAFSGAVIHGRVSDITPRGDPVNKVFRVRLSLPDDTGLMIGMTVEVNIVTRVVENALTLPYGSVMDGKVYILGKNGLVEPVGVKTGVTDGEYIEILDGLEGDERVVLYPSRLDLD